MNGFARIFEAIIASVILLAALTFFFVPQPHESGWEDKTLKVLAQDALESAYLNGTLARYVKTDNRTPLINIMSDMLSKTIDFSLEVRGIPNGIIYIACVDCTDTEKGELLKILNTTEFQYRGRNISVRVEQLQLAINPIPSDTNILFFFDKTKIPAYQSSISAFLKSGGSVFLLSDLAQADVEGVIGNVFNLTWAGIADPGDTRFDDIYNASKVSHFAAKYYANTTGRNLPDILTESFSVFNNNGVAAAGDDKNIAVEQGRAFVRADPAAVNGTGRTVWFSDYLRTDHSNGPTRRVDNLTKATIMWASGERFRLDVVEKTPAPVHFKTSVFVFDEDTYIADLIVWRIFF